MNLKNYKNKNQCHTQISFSINKYKLIILSMIHKKYKDLLLQKIKKVK